MTHITTAGSQVEPSSLQADGHLAALAARGSDVTLEPAGYTPRTIAWGEPWLYRSPAYWVARARMSSQYEHRDSSYSLGSSLEEEVVACLLGGFGITYESNVAAFNTIRNAGILRRDSTPTAHDLYLLLERPLVLSSGRRARYRFPRQRSERIANVLGRLRREVHPTDPLVAREWLLTFSGIGPKTASWVVRNRWPDIDVAIVDIHVWRAGTNCGIFDPSWTPARDYWQMEALFVAWARHGGVTAAALDVTIWAEQAADARRGDRTNGSVS